MSLCDVTPLILTYNEAPNIHRSLAALAWAPRVVVLDSGSTDATERIAKSYPNVDWKLRRFDRHREQWLYGIRETGIETPWVLALDADMIVPSSFSAEFRQSVGSGGYDGGVISFTYRAIGRDLNGSLYPADLRVFRPQSVNVIQDGHTQRFMADGVFYQFKCRVAHDDRKPLDRWTESQLQYSRLECRRLRSGGETGGNVKTQLRRHGMMPLLAGLAAYFKAGGPLKGQASLEYAYERMTFEALLAMRLLRGETGEDVIQGGRATLNDTL